MNKLIYYTDGGCEPNPGKGTWAFVRVDLRFEATGHGTNTGFEQSGHDPKATNNTMEMTAIIRAIENAIEQGAEAVDIYSDSQYCVKGFNQWMLGWAKNNWQKKQRWSDEWRMEEPTGIANLELWQTLYRYRTQYAQTMPIRLIWVKGHNGDIHNERCDALVRQEYQRVFGGDMKH